MLSHDGLKLFEYKYEVDSPKANLFLIHGYAEHCARYRHVVDFLNQNQYSVFGIDLRGHGKSEGLKAYVNSFDEYILDVHQWLKQFDQNHLPCFIYGHSMGGLVAALFLLKHPDFNPNFKGVLMTGPAFQPDQNLAPLLIKFSSVIGKYFPKLKTISLDPNFMSSDRIEVQKYIDDPLVYSGKWYARTGAELVRGMHKLWNSTKDFKFPVKILHGEKDRLAEPSGSKRFIHEIASTNKSIEIIKGGFHELVNEPNRAEIMHKMLLWMNQLV